MSVAGIKRIIIAAVLAMGFAGQAAAQANVTFFPTQYIAALADPDKFLSDWVVSSYRKASSPPVA